MNSLQYNCDAVSLVVQTCPDTVVEESNQGCDPNDAHFYGCHILTWEPIQPVLALACKHTIWYGEALCRLIYYT